MIKLSKAVATIDTLKRLVTNINNKYAAKASLSTVAYSGKYSDIKDTPSSLKNPNTLTVNGGVETVVYDGSSAKTVTIPSSLPANGGTAANSNNFAVTPTNPSTYTMYYVPFTSNLTGNQAAKANNGIRYQSLEGTTSSTGEADFIIGNNIASGTASNKQGRLRIYSPSTGYTDLVANTSTASSVLTLPSKTGIVATTSDIPTSLKNPNALTVKVNGTTQASYDGSAARNVDITKSSLHIRPMDLYKEGNTQGAFDPIIQGYIGIGRSNKTFGLPANAVTIEYSTDGGATWVDYGSTDDNKKCLFNELGGYACLGKNSDKTKNTNNNQLRITIEPTDRYCALQSCAIYFSQNGNTGCTVDLERSTIGNKNTFANKAATAIPLSGWSGWNTFWFAGGTFGGGSAQTSNFYKYRLTFKQTGANTAYTSPVVYDIRFYGYAAWSSPNNMVSKDHMYTWDSNFNVTFPKAVTATNFNGTATIATKIGTTTVGSASTPVYINAGKPTTCTSISVATVTATTTLNIPGGKIWIE